MKQLKYFCYLSVLLIGGLMMSCGDDSSDSGDDNGGSSGSSTQAIASKLVGSWMCLDAFQDGSTDFYYELKSDHTGTFTRMQGSQSFWYNFTWSAELSEGQYWLREKITSMSQGMSDWGYKVGKQRNDSFILSGSNLNIGGFTYTKR